MIIIETKTAAGVLQQVSLEQESGETSVDYKVAVKTWVAANLPTVTVADYIDKLLLTEGGRTIISMV